MIYDNLKQDMITAMKAKDQVRLSVIRSLIAACTNEAMAKGKKPNEPLDDNDVLAVIKRASNQRQDAINQFTSGNRLDLAKKEEEELKIIKTYLPAEMPDEDIKKIINDKKQALNITTKSDMGKLIGAVIKETAGRADGNTVKTLVEASF